MESPLDALDVMVAPTTRLPVLPLFAVIFAVVATVVVVTVSPAASVLLKSIDPVLPPTEPTWLFDASV